MDVFVGRSPVLPGQLFADLASRASADPSRAAYFAARLIRNKNVLTIYAASLCGLIAIFTIMHWTRSLSTRFDKSGTLLRPAVAITRLVRRQLLHYMPIFVTRGQSLVVFAWLALNAGFTVYNHGGPMTTSGIANRAGWLASANMAVVVFLAMKNTPLAILTTYSYERLNSLHRAAGYTVLAQTIVHAVAYTQYFLGSSQTGKFSEQHIIAGIVLGFAVLATVAVGVSLRRANYELFYILHVCFFIIIAVTFALHQPYLSTCLPIAIVTAGLWFYDRLIRTCRLVYNSINNEATLEPLPNGGTRVILKKPLPGAHAGKHCYLWLPNIRTFQTHPFTIVSNSPLELVISSRDGFTKKLHEFAVANPRASIKASAEGPYGTVPNPTSYDRVVLVSGGSGATFTHGLAEEILDKMHAESKQEVDLIWVVREHSNVSWFTNHLNNLLTHDKCRQLRLKVHVTDHIESAQLAPIVTDVFDEKTAIPSSPSSDTSRVSLDADDEKMGVHGRSSNQEVNNQRTNTTRYSLALSGAGDVSTRPSMSSIVNSTTLAQLTTKMDRDLESGFSTDADRANDSDNNITILSSSSTIAATPPATDAQKKLELETTQPSASFTLPPNLSLLPGRPDVTAYIREAVSSLGPDKRVLIAACGPPSMLKTVRNVSAECIQLRNTPSVELHCEQFGW